NGAIVGLTSFGQMILSGPAAVALFPCTAGLGFFLSRRVHPLGTSAPVAPFTGYGPLLRVMASSVLLRYTGSSLTRVFFVSAAAFGGLSLYGYTTQRNLSAMGSFLMMGLIGLIIAMLVNLFLKSTGLDFVISAVGVLIFAGLTAWDTQRIKEMYDPMEDGTIVGRKAVMGALSLYLGFINLFMFLLRFLVDCRGATARRLEFRRPGDEPGRRRVGTTHPAQRTRDGLFFRHPHPSFGPCPASPYVPPSRATSQRSPGSMTMPCATAPHRSRSSRPTSAKWRGGTRRFGPVAIPIW